MHMGAARPEGAIRRADLVTMRVPWAAGGLSAAVVVPRECHECAARVARTVRRRTSRPHAVGPHGFACPADRTERRLGRPDHADPHPRNGLPDHGLGARHCLVATRFVRSDRFENIWTQANRRAHSTVVRALTGQGRGAVGVAGGTVALDVGTAVDRVRQDLVDGGLSPAAKIQDVDKHMVLFRSGQLKRIRNGAHLLDVVGNWVLVFTALLGTIGVLLARRRWRALVTTALCAAVACLVLAVGLVIARRYHLPAQVQSRRPRRFSTLCCASRASASAPRWSSGSWWRSAPVCPVRAACRVPCAGRPTVRRNPPRAGAAATCPGAPTS